MNTAGPAFADLRHAAGLSVAAVARRAGVDAATIGRFEAGETVSTVTYWRLVAGLAATARAGGAR